LVLVEFHGDSEIGEKTRKMAKATTFITLPGTEISAVKDKLAGETPTPNHNGPRKKQYDEEKSYLRHLGQKWLL